MPHPWCAWAVSFVSSDALNLVWCGVIWRELCCRCTGATMCRGQPGLVRSKHRGRLEGNCACVREKHGAS
jgi:hypothetical protein